MEGSGGHTKECKVRTTTSAKPLLAAAPPFRASSGLILGNLLLHLRHLQPSTSFFTVSFSSAGGYNALSYKAVLSSPSLNCFPPPCFLLPSLSLPSLSLHGSMPVIHLALQRLRTISALPPSTLLFAHRSPALKPPNDTERVFPFALDGDTRRGSTSGHS